MHKRKGIEGIEGIAHQPCFHIYKQLIKYCMLLEKYNIIWFYREKLHQLIQFRKVYKIYSTRKQYLQKRQLLTTRYMLDLFEIPILHIGFLFSLTFTNFELWFPTWLVLFVFSQQVYPYFQLWPLFYTFCTIFKSPFNNLKS